MPMKSFRGMPGVPFMPSGPPAAVFVPVPEPHLPALLINQIDYYFSDANLIKDEYLKSNLDEQGWVPIALIAGFPRRKIGGDLLISRLDIHQHPMEISMEGDLPHHEGGRRGEGGITSLSLQRGGSGLPQPRMGEVSPPLFSGS
ncbi:hypothetical protein LWI28_014693 [Acer negundo]|uniref:HTH La-type RNA-binding domain-containing protein n=1 Tax=Acer negundo TaxID=4023 RepID=A0AAD5NE54_ACENE|nr:hypothetical protein LWI28_014693 [Acer negundo]